MVVADGGVVIFREGFGQLGQLIDHENTSLHSEI